MDIIITYFVPESMRTQDVKNNWDPLLYVIEEMKTLDVFCFRLWKCFKILAIGYEIPRGYEIVKGFVSSWLNEKSWNIIKMFINSVIKIITPSYLNAENSSHPNNDIKIYLL